MAERPVALLAGGRVFALPPGAEAVRPAPMRPVPLAGAGLLGLAVINGQAVPVLAAAPGLTAAGAWVLLDGPGGRIAVAGEALLPKLPPGADELPLLRPTSRPAPPPLPAGEGAWAVPARSGIARRAALAAELGGIRLALPFSALERVLPMPPLRPAPGADSIALGYALAAGEPALVLDPAALAEAEETLPEPTLLVVFRHAGRRLGLPCGRVAPARPGEATLVPRLDSLLPRLGAAPLGQVIAPPPPEPMRALLVCGAGGQPFAVPAEEVVAVLPPLAPSPAPHSRIPGFRGVAAHRGDVLPVLDAGERLGLSPVLAHAGAEAPMLRLGGPRPVALAVAQVTGLRRVPERLIAAVAGDGLVAAIASLQEAPLPICRTAVLGAAQ